MPRFIAIHTIPGLTEQKFKETFQGVKNWRPDARTTITKAYCSLAQGKVVTECEAVEQAHFEEWIKKVGWPVDAIIKLDLIQQGSNNWKL